MFGVMLHFLGDVFFQYFESEYYYLFVSVNASIITVMCTLRCGLSYILLRHIAVAHTYINMLYISIVAEFIDALKQENSGASGSRIQEIHIAEEFLKSLPELSYHVTKINQWGKHQQRIVRLTSYVFPFLIDTDITFLFPLLNHTHLTTLEVLIGFPNYLCLILLPHTFSLSLHHQQICMLANNNSLILHNIGWGLKM